MSEATLPTRVIGNFSAITRLRATVGPIPPDVQDPAAQGSIRSAEASQVSSPG